MSYKYLGRGERNKIIKSPPYPPQSALPSLFTLSPFLSSVTQNTMKGLPASNRSPSHTYFSFFDRQGAGWCLDFSNHHPRAKCIRPQGDNTISCAPPQTSGIPNPAAGPEGVYLLQVLHRVLVFSKSETSSCSELNRLWRHCGLR